MARRVRVARERDGGIAVVIGAVLVTVMVLTTIVAVRSSVVPAYQKEAEAHHMREVVGQFGNIVGELDRKVENASRSASLVPVALGTQSSSFFGGGTSSHRVALAMDDKAVKVTAEEIRLQEVNETPLTGLGEEWLAVPDGGTVDDIGKVHSFRLKVAQVANENDGDAVTLRILDKDGVFAGDIQMYVDDPGGQGYTVYVKTRDKDLNVLYDQGEFYHNQVEVSPYWIDIMDARYRFKGVLAATQAPLAIEMDEAEVDPQNLDVDYAITYLSASDQGVVLTGGGGLLVNDYEQSHTGGTLVYSGDNGQFVRQRVLVEHGAVILDQRDGAVFRSEPVFSATNIEDDILAITLHVATLRGVSDSVAGNTKLTVEARTLNQQSMIGLAPTIVVQVYTDFSELWADFFVDELEAADMRSVNCPPAGPGDPCNYDISAVADSVTLTLYGPTPFDTDVFDVSLSLKQASIRVDVAR